MATLHAVRESGPRLVRANRRAVPRVRAGELPWLERVRLADHGAVSLIDLSAGGALFEVAARLGPGDPASLEFLAQGDRTVASGRIVRSEIAGIGPDAVRYRGACEFVRPLAWARRLPSPGDHVKEAPTVVRGHAMRAWWGGWSEVVVVFRHGRRLTGFVRAFDPYSAAVDLWPSRTAASRERQAVPLALLRAIHFVRDLDDDGRAAADAPEIADLSQVEVAFRNNDIVRGAIAGYDPDQQGFWILSADHSPARRVFALAAAVAEIRVF